MIREPVGISLHGTGTHVPRGRVSNQSSKAVRNADFAQCPGAIFFIPPGVCYLMDLQPSEARMARRVSQVSLSRRSDASLPSGAGDDCIVITT